MASDRDAAVDQTVNTLGFTTLYVPIEPCTLDVVLVHGFTGHPERTWTRVGSTKAIAQPSASVDVERPSKLRRIFSSASASSPGASPKEKVYWPRHLLPETLPRARIQTYGYDTNIRHTMAGPISKNSLYAHASDFLVAIESERRNDPARPLILIAHSLGGLLIKEALRQSRGREKQPEFRQIFDSTVGLVFFGTPHEGADPLGPVLPVVKAFGKAIGFKVNQQIVEALSPSWEYQLQLKDEFNRMIEERDWKIHSFQEQYPFLGLGKKVVEDSSSSIRHTSAEVVQHISSNHKDMCRFSGSKDPEYQKVASALLRITQATSQSTQIQAEQDDPAHTTRRVGLNHQGAVITGSGDESRLQQILASLKFAEIDNRYTTVERAHAKTCQWLLAKPEYVDWLNAELGSPNCFLWMKGKPGAGKSTLMKSALSESRKRRGDGLVLSFFFNARGADLEKTTLGFYRSIVYQLLSTTPSLRTTLDTKELGNSESKVGLHWQIPELKEIFRSALTQPGTQPIVLYIDALDECAEDEIRNMISFFVDVGEDAAAAGVHLRVVLSSRHYPHITIRKGNSFKLEDQQEHNQDIINYVAVELAIGDGPVAEEIRAQVQDKSSGVFMWIVLVVRILNKEYDRGNMPALKKRLAEIPKGLYGLFEDILTRDIDNLDELWLCIQWVLFAKRPLLRDELYFAIMAGTKEFGVVPSREDMTMSDIGRYLLYCSKGLIEVEKKTYTIQFIHESVRDFLLKENGLGKLWTQLSANFTGASHDTLRRCCDMQLRSISGFHCSPYDERPVFPGGLSAILKQYPFLKYAASNVFYHADLAQGQGIPQNDFLETFDLAKWVSIDNSLEQYSIRRHTRDVTLFYILAEKNAHQLLRIHSGIRSHFTAPLSRERNKLPLYVAIAKGNVDAIRVLLDSEDDKGACNCGIVTPSPKSYCVRPGVYGQNYGSASNYGVISQPIRQGDPVLVHALLRFRFSRTDFSDKEIYKLFQGADASVFLILLLHGYVPSDQGLLNEAILHYAAVNGLVAPFQRLIEPQNNAEDAGVASSREVATLDKFLNISADLRGETALVTAARLGHHKIVDLLLRSRRVDPNGRGLVGGGLINDAMLYGHLDIVKLILDNDQFIANDKVAGQLLRLAYREGRQTHKAVPFLIKHPKLARLTSYWASQGLAQAVLDRDADLVPS